MHTFGRNSTEVATAMAMRTDSPIQLMDLGCGHVRIV